MKHRLLLVLLIITLLATISGCTDKLGKIDFSGRVELKPDTSGWAYRNIALAKVRPVKVDPDDRLGDYQEDLELQKAITVGKGEYIIIAKFKTDRISTGHDFLDQLLKADRFTVYGAYRVLVYDLNAKKRVDTIAAKDTETGNDWDERIDELKSDFKKRTLERKGEFAHYFREPGSQCDCIIEIHYNIQSEATRSLDEAGQFIEEDGEYRYDQLSVNGSASINIGFRQCLTGKRTIGDQSIRFYVLDWNLDGKFSEEDMAWSDHTNKTYEFGKVIRLTDSWVAKKDNTYRLKLVTPKSEQDKYELEIELVKKGKD